jgi:hypothetical protein
MPRSRLLSALAWAAAALPFAFGIVRAITTGNDFRYIWVALAASVGAAVVRGKETASRRSLRSALAITAAVFVISTCAAGLAAWLLGTAIGPGMLVVVSAFGCCFAIGVCLDALARPRSA